jgi:putative ABC transport system substrate-binding protein
MMNLKFLVANWKFKIRSTNSAGFFAITLALTLCGVSAQAQQPTKIARIGLLYASSSGNAHRVEAFRQGLRDLGYVEGKNIFLEYRYADGKRERFRAHVAELVRLEVDVIVTGGGGGTRPAKEATSTIPIVMTQDDDPVGNGLVMSLARPGGNITGLATLSPELSGKRLELLKEAVPRLSRVAIFVTPSSQDDVRALQEIQRSAGTLGVKLQQIEVRDPADIEAAFRKAKTGGAEALLSIMSGPVAASRRAEVAELAVKSRFPVMYHRREYVEVGGLMSYGVSFLDLDRRAATYVDKILKGAKPAELPVEQPTKFELIINMKAAKQIGLTIPPPVLARADRVIR